MQLPPFLDLVNDSLVFNQENKEFVFVVPEVFFNSNSKNAIAEVNGQYVSMIGLCEWYIIDSKGKKSELRPFRFPTMFLCKPYNIEKAKGLILEDITSDEDIERADEEIEELSKDYRLLHFKKGDEVVSQTRVPQIIDNVELFYKLAVITAKIPTSISYDEGWKLFLENMELNGNKYGLNAQLFGILWSELCRDPNDISRPFRYTNIKDMNKYKPISIKMIPKYTGIYSSIVSENWDESLRSAILMKDTPEEDLPNTPLERIITM